MSERERASISELFCGLVGDQGLVVAFEPRVELCHTIRRRLPDCEWLRVENVALGEFNAPSSLVPYVQADESGVETATLAEFRRGGTMCRQLGTVPSVIRVDAEGLEEEVLAGMGAKLASLVLREVIIEVSFLEFQWNGRALVPSCLQGLLLAMGFETRWVEGSHLLASRSRRR